MTEKTIEDADKNDIPKHRQIPCPNQPCSYQQIRQSSSSANINSNKSSQTSLRSSSKISNSATPIIPEDEKVDLYDPFATEPRFLADPFKFKRKTTSESASIEKDNSPLSQHQDYSSRSFSSQDSKKRIMDNDMFEPIYSLLSNNYADDEYIDPVVAVNNMFNETPNSNADIQNECNNINDISRDNNRQHHLPIPKIKNALVLDYPKDDQIKKFRRRSSSLDSRSVEGRAFREITPDGQTHIHLELNNTRADVNLGKQDVATLGRFRITRRVSQPRIPDKFFESDYDPTKICPLNRKFMINKS